jgi:uncharacterized protein (DUF1697 family)
MKTYIALFRGINIGGNNLLPMKDLKALLEKIGAQNVRTYIQSGNAVFQSKEHDASRLSQKISAEIKKSRGFEPFVLLLEEADLEKVIAANPFKEAESEPKSLHVIFLSAKPKKDALKTLEGMKKESEQFRLKGNIFYLHAPEGVGRSKLVANMERQFGVPTTGRNWRTVTRIMEMVNGQHG